ncbi:MAG: hypothetical protein Q8K11_01990 [Phenylobacterium sp.]|uniref:hypothetical protein n=1 Tax=Phenylobacterium sp. TaxID=1871053 RepID=UPI00273091E1|nr:hypothetical protein [Phenylobacterium sp.]MDP2008924.1 hypothetical protein [Phenylobacterium sp.]
MIALLGFLGSRLGGGIAAAIVAALTVGVGVQTVRLSGAHRDVAKLAAEIDRPVTGYKAQLATCKTNREELEAKIAVQNAAVAGLKAEAAKRTADAEKAVTEALKGRESAEARAAKLLRNPPAGIDTCARAMSAFEAVKESAR